MAKLFPWNSWLEMEDLTEEMQRIVEDTACPSPFLDNGRKLARFRPAADVIETPDAFLILVELPGLEREDVRLEAHGNELAVFGERQPPRNLAGAAFQVMERLYGCFSRRFELPVDIDAQAVAATMKSGLLHVRVPKRAQRAHNRAIPVVVDE
ncbi:MAG: Hsp20/alpha crystallin family protein [Desulfomicrobium sp.]